MKSFLEIVAACFAGAWIMLGIADASLPDGQLTCCEEGGLCAELAGCGYVLRFSLKGDRERILSRL